MAAPPPRAGRLDGWKEIAKHLNCDVRTCLRWEKDLGLPVIRINKESKRSKVIAYASDIDEWLTGNREPLAAEHRLSSPARIAIVAAAVLVLAAAAYIGLSAHRSTGPAYWALKGQALVFYDVRDRELWSLEIDGSANQSEAYADRGLVNSQGRSINLKWDRPKVAMADIDGDGKKEVACFLNHENPFKRSIWLGDHDGRRLWEKTIDCRVRYPQKPVSQDFRLLKIAFEDVNGDGRPEILSLWAHVREHPGIFLIHSLEGECLFRYDHTGILQNFLVHYASPEGRAKEILLGGTNNLLGGDAVLIVLDCRDLKSGLGPPYEVPPDLAGRKNGWGAYTPADYVKAGQMRYYRFRRDELADALRISYLNILEIRPTPGGATAQLAYGAEAFVYYNLDFDKGVLDVSSGVDTGRTYGDLLARKMVSAPLEDFLHKAGTRVQVWDGAGWGSVPTIGR